MNNANIQREIQNLRMNNVNIAQECDERVAAMGSDMGNVIHRYKRLIRKYRKRNIYPRSKLLQSGNGLIKKSISQKSLKSFVNKTPKSRFLASTTVSVCNNWDMHWRGEEDQRGSDIFRSVEVLQRNLGIGGMLRSRNW